MAKVNAYNLTKQISKSANELLDDILKSQEQVGNRIETIKRIEMDLLKKQQAQEADAQAKAFSEEKSGSEPAVQAPIVEPTVNADVSATSNTADITAKSTEEKPTKKKTTTKTKVDVTLEASKSEDEKPAEIKVEKAPTIEDKPAEVQKADQVQATTENAAANKPAQTGSLNRNTTQPQTGLVRNTNQPGTGTGTATYRNNNQQQTGFVRNTNQPGTGTGTATYRNNNQQQTGFVRNTNQPGTGTGTATYRNNNQQQTGFVRNTNQPSTGTGTGTATYRNNNQPGTYNRPAGQSTYNNQGTGTGTATYRNNNQPGTYNRPAGQSTYNNQGTGSGTATYRNNNQQQGGYSRPAGQQGGYNNTQGGYNNRPAGGQQSGYNNRPAGGQQGGFNKSNSSYGARGKAAAPTLAPPLEKERVSNYDPNKSTYDNKKHDYDKKSTSRKLILNKTQNSFDDSRYHKGRKKKPFEAKTFIEPIKIDKATVTGDTLTIKEFSEKIGKPASDIIKKLLLLGVMATINNEIDYDMATLIANEYGIELEQKFDKTYEEVMIGEYEESEDKGAHTRPPVVTIMGHVDHGKTSLLDFIRTSSIVKGEAGGITQHIGAYTVDVNSKMITFLDTPGHEAFTSMRARGAQVTDIAILVIAADDGIMPQTIEAINHAKAAEVPIIVAITKIDRPNINIERIKQQLTEQSLLIEEWGGETVVVPLSSHTGEGIPQLLEMILLVADVQELTADPEKPAKGAIIEAKLDKGRGPVATVLVQNGTLRTGDTIIAGVAYGRVRALINDKGERIDSAGPSVPVEVLGFSEVPEAGDTLYVVGEDKLSKQVAEERRDKIKADQLKTISKVTLDDLFTHISEGNIKELPLVIKADVQGSAEAIKQSLEKLSNENVRVRVIHSGVGAITKHDILLATASNGIIIGFNVRPDQSARTSPDFDNVDIRTYRVIYKAIEDVEKAMKGLLDPVFKEVILGHAEVRQIFKVSNIGTIAGSYVQDGKITNNSSVRVLREGVVVHEGTIDTLKRFKDDAKEVAAGYECGIGLKNFNDVKEGDIYELYVDEQVITD